MFFAAHNYTAAWCKVVMFLFTCKNEKCSVCIGRRYNLTCVVERVPGGDAIDCVVWCSRIT